MEKSDAEIIARSSSPFTLTVDHDTIELTFVKSEWVKSVKKMISDYSEESRLRFSLRLMSMKGNATFPKIDVYVNLEKGEPAFESRKIGALALYGIQKSSTPSPGVAGNGFEERFNVGESLRYASKQSNWSDDGFSITLIPQYPLAENAALTIDRVALYCFESDH